MGIVSLVAVLLIGLGLFRVVQVYRHYRENMLTYESRHLNSITASGAQGLGWLLDGYRNQAEQFPERRETVRAEEEYIATGDTEVIRRLLTRPDALPPFMRGSLAAYDTDGDLIAVREAGFPLPEDGIAEETEGLVVRTDEQGGAWFVFSAESTAGLRYELAITVQNVFSYQSEASRIGQHGYLFLLDNQGRFVSFAGEGQSYTCTVDELIERFPALNRGLIEELSHRESAAPDSYLVVRYPWPESTSHSGEETLVVTTPVISEGSELILGAAVSFREFDSLLSEMLQEVTGVIFMEIGGALLLFLMATWILVENRRNRLELEAVRERADLMEEINRQQQSLTHTERLQQLGVMTSGIVHEFNNLLTPIMGQSMLLLEELADEEDSPEFESALDIYEASENARDILRRMSGMGKRDVDMSFRVLEVGDLLKKTLNLASMARDPHIIQELKLPGGPVYISGNEQLLTQAFLNLCINACQAMGEEGTLTVEAETEDKSGGRYVSIRVADTGPGIAEEKIGSIYDPFYTTKGEHGTGLGLAICQKIIETHKGTIQAANRESGGAVFTVRIPACEPAADD